MKRKHWDFLHKLSYYYAREYDLVAVEDLYAKGLMELPLNSCNRAGAAWETFLRMLEYKCEREGTHFVVVDPGGTTNEYAGGVEPDKPLWVREHSCPPCGFTADRDWNGAYNILVRGLKQVRRTVPNQRLRGLRSLREPMRFLHSAFTRLRLAGCQIQSDNVVETGSPTRTERAQASRWGGEEVTYRPR